MRILSAEMKAAIATPEKSPYLAVRFAFDSGIVRLWTGVGDRVIEGETYHGTQGDRGHIMGFGDVDEKSDLVAQGVQITFVGIPSDILALALSEPYQRRSADVYFGLNDLAPVLIYQGIIDTMDAQDNGDTSNIKIALENRLLELNNAPNWRNTHESHTARHTGSGDTFFSYVANLQEKEVPWGRESA